MVLMVRNLENMESARTVQRIQIRDIIDRGGNLREDIYTLAVIVTERLNLIQLAPKHCYRFSNFVALNRTNHH